MKQLTAVVLGIAVMMSSLLPVAAQSPETAWMEEETDNPFITQEAIPSEEELAESLEEIRARMGEDVIQTMAETMTLAQFNAKVEKFLSDNRWKAGTTWTWSQRPKLSSWNGIGCFSYAADFAAYVYGQSQPRSSDVYSGNAQQIRTGDIIHEYYYSRQGERIEHWIIVLAREGNQLKVAEGAFGSKVRVSYDYSISGNVLTTSYGTGFVIADAYHFPITGNASTPSSEATANQIDADKSSGTLIYRVYNTRTGEHLYTPDAKEKDVLVTKYGWTDEGKAWNAPASGEKVYRLFNPANGDHLYTMDETEVKVLTQQRGWRSDFGGKALFYSGGDIPIYRLYHPGTGRHLLTSDKEEYAALPRYGWLQEKSDMKGTR